MFELYSHILDFKLQFSNGVYLVYSKMEQACAANRRYSMRRRKCKQ